mmetsp:Transcript_25037/g.36954  ORF Transcript_25037/g.36954 Transcript_25037/m.36954 type:complete len:466 (-) Transcript_25037:48-1445(-)
MEAPYAVYFTGGTALQDTASAMGFTDYMHEHSGGEGIIAHTKSVHIVTCFDSGGSSAILRQTVPGLPAVGDIRNRICSIAEGRLRALDAVDPSAKSLSPLRLVRFFHHRLPSPEQCVISGITNVDLRNTLEMISHCSRISLESGIQYDGYEIELNAVTLVDHLQNLLVGVPHSTLIECLSLLSVFLKEVPCFDFAGASLGNLILTGAYLSQDNNRCLAYAVRIVREMMGIPELVLPCSVSSCTLGARLLNSRVVMGQHRITSPKGSLAGIESPIDDLFLVNYAGLDQSIPSPDEVSVECKSCASALPEVLVAIGSASLLCYPIGSFYTSLLACLLADDIASTIFNNVTAKKVFVPNMIRDTESLGMKLHDLVRTLCAFLTNQCVDKTCKPSDFVSVVLLDSTCEYDSYGGIKCESVEIIRDDLGISVWQADICRQEKKGGAFILDPVKFLSVIDKLASKPISSVL